MHFHHMLVMIQGLRKPELNLRFILGYLAGTDFFPKEPEILAEM